MQHGGLIIRYTQGGWCVYCTSCHLVFGQIYVLFHAVLAGLIMARIDLLPRSYIWDAPPPRTFFHKGLAYPIYFALENWRYPNLSIIILILREDSKIYLAQSVGSR